jgi:hypothetical protein
MNSILRHGKYQHSRQAENAAEEIREFAEFAETAR